MTSWGSSETDRGRTKRRSAGRLGRLSFSFGFERSRVWAGCGGPWAAISPWWIVFAMRMGYPVLLVLDTVEAATHELQEGRTAVLGCCYPRPVSLATTHDSLETIGVDVGSTTWPPSRVRHRLQPPRAKPLEHQDPRRLLRAKVTLRGYLCELRRWWGTGPTPVPLTPPLTSFSPCRHPVGTFHGGNIMRRNRSPG
jgi:hypothetical protein